MRSSFEGLPSFDQPERKDVPFIVPDFKAKSVLDVSPEVLGRLGIRHFLTDFDQTLLAPGERDIRPEIVEHLVSLRRDGPIETINLATETARNVHKKTEPLAPDGIFRPFLSRGRLIFKSNPEFYTRILDELGVDPSTVLMVGDYCMKDIKGPNQIGITTLKVEPLGPDSLIDRRRRRRDDQALAMAQAVVGGELLPTDLEASLEGAGHKVADRVGKLLFGIRSPNPEITNDPEYRALVPKIGELYDDAADWHGTGRYQYRDGEVVDVLRGILDQNGLIPFSDSWDPKMGEMASISTTPSNAYARVYARTHHEEGLGPIHQVRQAKGVLLYVGGTMLLRATREFGLSGIRSRLASRRGAQKSTLPKRVADWTGRLTNREHPLRRIFALTSDIPGNYPMLIGIKEGAFTELETSQTVSRHERRSGEPIPVGSFTHIEVPASRVDETKQFLEAHEELGTPILPEEWGEEYARTLPFTVLAQGRREITGRKELSSGFVRQTIDKVERGELLADSETVSELVRDLSAETINPHQVVTALAGSSRDMATLLSGSASFRRVGYRLGEHTQAVLGQLEDYIDQFTPDERRLLRTTSLFQDIGKSLAVAVHGNSKKQSLYNEKVAANVLDAVDPAILDEGDKTLIRLLIDNNIIGWTMQGKLPLGQATKLLGSLREKCPEKHREHFLRYAGTVYMSDATAHTSYATYFDGKKQRRVLPLLNHVFRRGSLDEVTFRSAKLQQRFKALTGE